MKTTPDFDDIPDLTEAFWSQAKPASEILPTLFSHDVAEELLSRRHGQRMIALDADIVTALEKIGPDWQNRLNGALRHVLGVH
jgi:uncharacterized protein (DUF4415 family)